MDKSASKIYKSYFRLYTEFRSVYVENNTVIEGFFIKEEYFENTAGEYFIKNKSSHPSGIVASDADCCAVESLLVSNPGADMDVCKCIVPAWHRGTLNSRRTASPLVRLVEGEKRWGPLTIPRVFSL
ncbi:hypothetical protein TNCV_3311481 [Trichonephila clavipes]|nr:hypothetical protein TNCV_3311481 [Trichonephila clavipes]